MQYTNSQFATSQKVDFLRQRTSYPDVPARVDTLETHMSWVFLTDNHVYKMKKPVRTPVLDFSTLEARYRDCQAELQLNRRLAPDVYLAVVPLTVDTSDRLRLRAQEAYNGEETIDWLVKMRRLPAEGMLDYAVIQGTAQPSDIRRLGETLATFYQQARPVDITPQEYCHRLEADLRAIQQELEQAVDDLPKVQVPELITPLLKVLENNAALFTRRVDDRCIVEGHGDLRPQHVCLWPQIAIIDCLEFNRTLRILDPVDELAFLGLECERLGAAWVEEILFATYSDITQDQPSSQLIHFYKAYRACLRAKLAVWHMQEPGQNGHNHWLYLARTYLQLGEKYS